MITHQRLEATLDDAHHLAAIFFGAAGLATQPWYAQFRRGSVAPIPSNDGVVRAARSVSTFDVGLGAPRAYAVLCAEVAVDPSTRVVTLRSIPDGLPPPEPAVVAELRPPSGDVFFHDGTALHWHHVVVTPGVGLGPSWFDRGLLRLLRGLGLDGPERRTYRDEAEGLVRFVGTTDLGAFCAEHGLTVR